MSFTRNLLIVCALALGIMGFDTDLQAEAAGWNDPSYLSVISQKPPTFPNRDFVITNYGAVPDGITDSRDAFTKAITAANAAGGGKVVVPAGNFFVAGPITLKSNVNLYLSDNSTIKFSDDSTKYANPLVLTRFESTEIYNYSPLIYAYGATNVAVTGSGSTNKGKIDGNGTKWWNNMKPGWEKSMVRNMGNSNTPLAARRFGEGYRLRPNLVQFYRCNNVLIDGVYVTNSPMWNINPTLCTNVTIKNLTIVATGPNTDGIDPDSCKNVLIQNNDISTGDDCIAIKSGRDGDGRRVNVPSQNIVVRGNYFRDGHGAVTAGSEMSGSVYNVYSENNTMASANLQWAYRFKTNSLRGGVIENYYARNDTINIVKNNFLIVDMNYEGGDIGPFTPVIRNIFLDNIKGDAGNKPILSLGSYSRNPVVNIKLSNCTITNAPTTGGFFKYTGGMNGNYVTLSNVNINGTFYNGKGTI